jgi:hypothetical protein
VTPGSPAGRVGLRSRLGHFPGGRRGAKSDGHAAMPQKIGFEHEKSGVST